MDPFDPTVQTEDAVDVAGNANDTLISPYTSPQKDHLSTDIKYGSGDFMDDSENNRSLANQICALNVEKKAEQAIEELPAAMPNDDSEAGEEVTQQIRDIEAVDPIAYSGIETGQNVEITNDESEDSKEVSNTLQDENEPTSESVSLPSPEEEKEKIFAEMLASAGDTTPNEELTPTELISISKQMEEEFRNMVMEEQQKKKLSMEGPSHAANKNLLNGAHHAITTDVTPKQSLNNSSTSSLKTPKSAKSSFTSRLPTSQSRTTRPTSARTTLNRSALPNKGPSASPARSATKARCTPTTIRLTPRNTTSESNLRSPLQPTTAPIQTRFRRSSPSNTNISTTPFKAASTTQLPSPRTTTPVRRPLSSPRRPPSVQSSDSGGRCTMPNMRHVQSKIGSLENAKHTPGGGKVKIESRRSDYSQVTAKVGSKVGQSYTPSGGKVKIESKRLDYSTVQSKCGSLSNTTYSPGGGKVKIASKKLDYSHVGSKCGSLANASHTPGGGKVKVESKKLDYGKVSSKCGSLDNMKHTPQGGNVKIFHSSVNTSKVQSKIGSKDNIGHTPGGGKVKIVTRSIDLSHVKSKCGSLDYASHVPGGGNVEIFNETPQFKETAKAKVGSLDNAAHVPGGGDIRIYDEKLHFRELASPRTDVGLNGIGSEGSLELVMST